LIKLNLATKILKNLGMNLGKILDMKKCQEIQKYLRKLSPIAAMNYYKKPPKD